MSSTSLGYQQVKRSKRKVVFHRLLMCLVASASLVVLKAQDAKAAPEQGPLGAGIVLGSPTGLTGKYWMNERAAADFGISFAADRYIMLYADYLVHTPKFFDVKLKRFEFYWGVGGMFAIASKDRNKDDNIVAKESGGVGAGIRIPLGIEWQPHDPPLGVFAEIAPGLSIFPATDAIIHAGIGVRYYF